MEHIQIVILKNGDLLKVFPSLQETHRYLKEFVPGSDNQLYEIINQGIDDDKDWIFKEDVYKFKTTNEARLKRADRRTRA